MGTPTGLIYRQLPADEWERLREPYRLNGGELPSQDCSTSIVAEKDSRIVGFWGLNYILHAGPIWVAPEFRGQGVSDSMAEVLDELLRAQGAKGYLMFPSNPRSEAVA